MCLQYCWDQLEKQQTNNQEFWIFALTKNNTYTSDVLIRVLKEKQNLAYSFKISFPVDTPEG